MKTDQLIEMLGTNVEPVDRRRLLHALILALTAGTVAAMCLMSGLLGVPSEPLGGDAVALKVAALAFTLSLAGSGAAFLARAARPGESGRARLVVIGLVALVFVCVAGIALMLTNAPVSHDLLLGPHWATCLVCIPLFALLPFAALVWAVRQGAPTNLRLTGAIAGLVAGAVSAAAFALHHPSPSIPFTALWYGGPIVLCAVAGAALGPRLLRW